MEWVFAVLIVLALGVVAVLASGRGAGPAGPEHDRVPVELPVGRIGADDLRTVRFPLAVRGYRTADVDALLDRLAEQLQSEPRDEHPRD